MADLYPIVGVVVKPMIIVIVIYAMTISVVSVVIGEAHDQGDTKQDAERGY